MKALSNPIKGSLLISEPFLEDDFFNRSVILLAEQTSLGSMGFILNKPVGYAVHELLEEFPEFDAPVYFGGPVENNALFMIHTVPQLIGSAFEIAGGIHYGGDFDKLKELVPLGIIKPNQIRFFVGYSGWDAGQLDHEMKEESWLIFDRPSAILDLEPEALWGSLIRNSESEKAIWFNFPDNPTLN
jgi:putative transcriptional regulator